MQRYFLYLTIGALRKHQKDIGEALSSTLKELRELIRGQSTLEPSLAKMLASIENRGNYIALSLTKLVTDWRISLEVWIVPLFKHLAAVA